MEEEEGFEPPRGLPACRFSRPIPSAELGYSSVYIMYWWTLQDSNLRPDGYEPSALTNWAKGPLIMVAAEGIEPPTLRVWTVRSSQLSYTARIFRIICNEVNWWSLAGSNRWPPACKAGALPAELRPQRWSGRQDSNLRPLGPKPSALPSWATSRIMKYGAPEQESNPLTFWSVVRRSIQLSYGRNNDKIVLNWCRGPESNRYGSHLPQDFKSCASASSATPANSSGAEDGIRTRDPHLGKVVFYHWTTSAIWNGAGEGTWTPTPCGARS